LPSRFIVWVFLKQEKKKKAMSGKRNNLTIYLLLEMFCQMPQVHFHEKEQHYQQ